MTNFPIWAQTNEAQRLLRSIAANPPRVERYDDGLSAFNGRRYLGTRAEQLRDIWEPFYDLLMQWVSAARGPAGRPQPALWEERHDAVARYVREFGPDAVIAKTLGDAA